MREFSSIVVFLLLPQFGFLERLCRRIFNPGPGSPESISQSCFWWSLDPFFFNSGSDVQSSDDPPATRTSSPWLMLPPAFGGGDMIYKFYSLADKQVLSFNKSKMSGNSKAKKDDDMPDHDADFVGSSHGWLIFFNRFDKKMFLGDPFSRRHVELPPINSLAIPESNFKGGRCCVKNVIISSSDPDDDDGHAMMTFGPQDRLAFCCPGHSLEWTPIGKVYTHKSSVACSRSFVCPHCDNHKNGVSRRYPSFVYSTKQKLLFTVNQDDLDDSRLGIFRTPSPSWLPSFSTRI